MTFAELLAMVVERLDHDSVPYMVTRSLASSYRADLLGTAAFVATAEDLVIAKLEWASASGSDRQLDDVAGILAIAPSLDIAYIGRWVRALDLEDVWERVRAG